MAPPRSPLTAVRRAADAARDFAAFSKDPYTTMERLYARNGPVSWLGVGPVRFVLLLGPEANRFVLANTELFTWRQAFAGLVPLAGEGALLVNDGARHHRLRRLVQPAFTARGVARHVATVREHVARTAEGWRRGDVVDAHRELRTAIRRATVESLFGARAVERSAPLQAWLQAIHRLIDTSSLARQAQQSLGLTAWKRALAARHNVERWVGTEIERRRAEAPDGGRDGPVNGELANGGLANGEPAPDVLGRLLAATDDEGGRLTDTEIADQLVSLLEAGAETTSSALTWTLYGTLGDRDIWEPLAEEARAAAPEDAPVEAGHLAAMNRLDRAVSETLRLYPATVVASRMAATGFSFAGLDFPAGTRLVFSPYLTHRLPELWPDPLRFDPDRWDPASAGHRRPQPHEYLPFGGGPHRCVGAAFATMAVRTAVAHLARHLDLWLVARDVGQDGLIGMRPRDGLPLLVTRNDRARTDPVGPVGPIGPADRGTDRTEEVSR